MIDLSYQRKSKPSKTEPEEIAVAIMAVAIWIGCGIAFLAAL